MILYNHTGKMSENECFSDTILDEGHLNKLLYTLQPRFDAAVGTIVPATLH